MELSSLYPLFWKTKYGLGVSHPDIFMIWFGGIDFRYRLSRKKKKIELDVRTHIPKFQYLSSILSYTCIPFRPVHDRTKTASCSMNDSDVVFYKRIREPKKKTVSLQWEEKINFLLNPSPQEVQDFSNPNDTIQQIVLRNPRGYTNKEITVHALVQFSHFFQHSLHDLCRWSMLLRRGSMRNSWKRLLETKRGYFLLAVQTYQQCSHLAWNHRAQFVSSLSHSALWLSIPEWAESARYFHQSSEQWKRIGEVLISLEDPSLDEAMNRICSQTFNEEEERRLCCAFEHSKINIDVSFRLEVLQATLARIIHLESKGLETIVKGVQSLSDCGPKGIVQECMS